MAGALAAARIDAMAVPPIDHLATVDSTNAEAMRRALAGARGPLWILADTQTAGRGRAGRSWASSPGNLQASLLLTTPQVPAKAYQLALVAGLGVYDCLSGKLPEASGRLRLKWPNDILIDGAKAGGILIESSTLPGGGLAAVIGIGINIVSSPAIAGRRTACLADFGAAPDPWSLLLALAETMQSWIKVWEGGLGFYRVRNAWLDRAHPLGERMAINTGLERLSGIFQGLDEEGALLLDAGGGIRRFTFGDVSLDDDRPE